MESIHVSVEPGGILSLIFSGSIVDESDVSKLKKDIAVVEKNIKDFYQSSKGVGVKILIDISNLKAEYVDEGVDALVELAQQDEKMVKKTAIFGGLPTVRDIGKTIVALSGRENINFFETKTEALDWLH